MLIRIAIVLAALGMVAGCVERDQELTAAEREQIRPYLLGERPMPEHPLSIEFEDRIELLGYDLSSDTWAAGTRLTVTWYWHVKRSLEDDYLLFTHLADASDVSRKNFDSDGALREVYPPGKWQQGQFIKDVQELTLPADWNSDRGTFYLGIYRGDTRLRVTEGPHDGDRRARVMSIPTSPRAATARPNQDRNQEAERRVVAAVRRNGDIAIDGQLDESAWQAAPWSRAFVHPQSNEATEPRSRAKMLWDEEAVYFAFDVRDDFLRSTFRNRDDHLWAQDAVEVFLDVDGNGQDYYELQVSPASVIFDTRYDRPREPAAPGHVDWNPELLARSHVDGTLNDGDADQGYTVEIRLPFTSLRAGNEPVQAPSAGTTWRANFFVMDARQDGQRAAAWSAPLVGDFHRLERFGVIRFSEQAEAVAPRAANSPRVQPLGNPSLGLRGSKLRAVDREGSLGRQVQARDESNRPQGNEPVPTRDNPTP